MVCPRCITVVKQELDRHSIPYEKVELGLITLSESSPNLPELLRSLESHGFEIIRSNEAHLAEKVRIALLHYVASAAEHRWAEKVSEMLEARLQMSYSSISRTFSSEEGQTVTRYLTHLKIERSKQLLQDGELSVKEIAALLGFSTPQYFYRQFQKATGYSVKEYRQRNRPSNHD